MCYAWNALPWKCVTLGMCYAGNMLRWECVTLGMCYAVDVLRWECSTSGVGLSVQTPNMVTRTSLDLLDCDVDALVRS